MLIKYYILSLDDKLLFGVESIGGDLSAGLCSSVQAVF